MNMCRFARDCLQVMEILTKKLEVKLGPDTGEVGHSLNFVEWIWKSKLNEHGVFRSMQQLSMRFGLHSGPGTLKLHLQALSHNPCRSISHTFFTLRCAFSHRWRPSRRALSLPALR